MVADVCAEKNENIGGDVSYTIQDFLVYMQHGYTDYNIFGTYATSDALFVTNDSMLEYRKIDTDTISVSGKIAVVCDLDNSMDDNKSDSISCLIENNKSEYLNKIYQGSNIPDTISHSYLDCDDLKVPEFQGFDLYIFEKSALEGEITEEVFLKLDELLKQGEATYIYNIDIVKNSFATGESQKRLSTMVNGQKQKVL